MVTDDCAIKLSLAGCKELSIAAVAGFDLAKLNPAKDDGCCCGAVAAGCSIRDEAVASLVVREESEAVSSCGFDKSNTADDIGWDHGEDNAEEGFPQEDAELETGAWMLESPPSFGVGGSVAAEAGAAGDVVDCSQEAVGFVLSVSLLVDVAGASG